MMLTAIIFTQENSAKIGCRATRSGCISKEPPRRRTEYLKVITLSPGGAFTYASVRDQVGELVVSRYFASPNIAG